MKNLNIQAPINKTGYGIASLNTIKALYNIGYNISYFPIGNPNVDNADDHKLFSQLIQQSVYPDPKAPFIKIWHQFDLMYKFGLGKYFAYTFFELDTFDKREKLHLSVPDTIFVTSNWAKTVIENNGITNNVEVVPLGVDLSIFDYNISSNLSQDKYIFLNIGKWEVRKGHDILYQLFDKAFPDEKDVELWILASEKTNSYSSPEELKQWKKLYDNPRIKLFNGVNNHSDIAKLISQSNCGIYPSRAEGWNLELLETMAMNKPVISTNYSSHTEFCNKDNCYLVDIDNIEKAYDGKAFIGQGNWAKIENKQIDQFIEHMRYCYNNKINSNNNGIITANRFNWYNSAKIIQRCIDQIS